MNISIKKLGLLLLFTVLSLLPISRSLYAQNTTTMTIENQSQIEICYVFFSFSTETEWGQDRLGTQETILPDMERSWEVPAGVYDVQLQDCQGNILMERYQEDLTLSTTLIYSAAVPPIPTAVPSLIPSSNVTFTIENQSEVVICGVFFSLNTDTEWGNNQLRMQEAIYPGNTRSWQVAAGVYDVQLQDCQQNIVEEHYQQDLTYSLTLTYSETIEQPVFLDDPSVLLQESVALLQAGDLPGALEYANKALDGFRQAGDAEWEGNSLYQLGQIYSREGRYTEALDYFQQSIAIAQRIGDDDGIARNLSEIGDMYGTLGRYAEALDYLEQGLTIAREIGSTQGQGVILKIMGDIYKEQGRYSEALDSLEQALAIARQIRSLEGQSATLISIANVYVAQGRNTEALDYYEQALTFAREIGYRAAEGNVLNAIGSIYESQGQYMEALDHVQQALAIAREIRNREGEGVALDSIGSIYEAQGKNTEALDYYQQALVIAQEIGNRINEGHTLNNMGATYANLGQYAEALNRYQEALAIAREFGNRAGEGHTLNNIATVYFHLGQHREALDYYQQSLSILREIGNRTGQGGVLNNIGGIYHTLGQNTEALDYYQQALEVARELSDRIQESGTLNNIGTVYHDQAQYSPALTYYQQALGIAHELGAKDEEADTLSNIGTAYYDQRQYSDALNYHQQALAVYQETGNREGESHTLAKIAFSYEDIGELQQATEYYVQAVQIIETIHADIGLESGQVAFLSQDVNVYPYEGLVTLLAHSDPIQAFHYAERGRARTFLTHLSSEFVPFGTGADADLLTEWEAKRDELTALRQRRVELASQLVPPAEGIREVDATILQAEGELDRLTEQITLQNPRLSQITNVTIPPLAEIQAAIPADSTLLSYYLTDEQVYVFVLTSSGFALVQLPVSAEEIRQTVELFRSDELSQAAALVQLYDWLIAPIQPNLTTPDLIIAPHDVLNYIPFAALQDAQGGYVLDHFTVSYTPSATIYTVLHASRTPSPIAETSLIIGNPATSLPPLPFAEQEAQEVAAVLGVESISGGAATEAFFRANLEQADVVHLATHGSFNPRSPLSSFLAFTPDAENDGYLEVREIYSLPLQEHTPLVVLSACQTAVGELTGGDDLQGLTRAFLLSGARAVVASLWSVDDEATSALMVAFYQNRAAGMSDAEALAAAQQTIRSDPAHLEWQSPYYWAAFVVVGLEQ